MSGWSEPLEDRPVFRRHRLTLYALLLGLLLAQGRVFRLLLRSGLADVPGGLAESSASSRSAGRFSVRF